MATAAHGPRAGDPRRRTEESRAIMNEQPESTTVLTPVFEDSDDAYHTPLPDADRFWTETNWWSLNIPERRLGMWLHCQYHPIRETVTWRVFAWDPRGAD